MRTLLKMLLIVLAAFFIYAVLTPRAFVGMKATDKAQARDAVVRIVRALDGYKVEYSAYPAKDSATLIKTLGGENPRAIVFLEYAPEEIDSQGNLLDPWGTPYHIEFPAAHGEPLRVWSSGRDRIDNHGAPESDDVRSW